MIRRLAVLLAVLLIAGAGTGPAAAVRGQASAVVSVLPSAVDAGQEESGSYVLLTEAVAGLPDLAALPPERLDPARAVVAAVAAEAGVSCRSIPYILRGRQEHPAYTVVTALCDCENGRGQQVNVLVFPTGRAAALSLGEVTVEAGAAGVRFYAF